MLQIFQYCKKENIHKYPIKRSNLAEDICYYLAGAVAFPIYMENIFRINICQEW